MGDGDGAHPMTEGEIRRALTHVQATACTMLAEAAGDSLDGSSVEERIAVGCVIRNRVKAGRFGTSFRDVCLKPKQFSCWNPGTDRNHVRLVEVAGELLKGVFPDPVMVETLYLAEGILGGAIIDRTRGATHYYAPDAMVPEGSKPRWVYKNGRDGEEHLPLCRVGRQRFYRVA